jgi:hypothetical protein
MARRQPKTLLEWNVLLALGSLMTEEEREAKERLPLMRQAQLAVKAMPKATRIAEFIAMWTIAKAKGHSTSTEDLAEFWGEPPRTMYRRLAEFREAWGPGGYETPDPIADHLIADYRGRKEKLEAGSLARLLGADVSVSAPVAAGVIT